MIRPSKESVQSLKNKVKAIFKKNRGIPAHGLIRLLNPVIRGWSNYHKGICAKDTFAKLGTFIYWQLKRWAKYQHGNQKTCYRLFRIAYVPIRYHVKIKSKANPYLPEFDKYFIQRRKWREDLAKESKQITTFIEMETNINSRVALRQVSLKSA
ncbi:MAG: group II intron maturase-specific domain-containing protein [candidate division Zixibacteria bacterium]|nr:group II intron maturase-specific domain-containing protein [candidate division Zixibacteria bacterium]